MASDKICHLSSICYFKISNSPITSETLLRNETDDSIFARIVGISVRSCLVPSGIVKARFFEKFDVLYFRAQRSLLTDDYSNYKYAHGHGMKISKNTRHD